MFAIKTLLVQMNSSVKQKALMDKVHVLTMCQVSNNY